MLVHSLVLDLGMGDEDSVLVGTLQDATRLSDGRIALLDSDRKAVVFVSPEGATLATVGREGAGPGEYTFPGYIGRCRADSLYVWDMGQSRVTILAPDGQVARQFTPPTPAPFQPECLSTGEFAMLDASAAESAPFNNDPEAPPINGTLLIVSPVGDSIASAPDLPLGQPRAIGTLAGLAVTDDRIVVGLNASPLLRTFGRDARPLSDDSVPVPATPLAEERYLAMVDRLLEPVGADSSMRARFRDMLLKEGKPEMAPRFSSMHGAPDGTVWWVTSLPVDSSTTLLGFRHDTPLRRLRLPAGIQVFEVGDDYLLGKRTDELGSERVVLYVW
jgi:hypothetical protein